MLRELHDELDAAVASAYGWPATLSDEETLARLVRLNSERAAEERQGRVRWLRPDFQQQRSGATQAALDIGEAAAATVEELLQTLASLGQAREVASGRFVA